MCFKEVLFPMSINFASFKRQKLYLHITVVWITIVWQLVKLLLPEEQIPKKAYWNLTILACRFCVDFNLCSNGALSGFSEDL